MDTLFYSPDKTLWQPGLHMKSYDSHPHYASICGAITYFVVNSVRIQG